MSCINVPKVVNILIHDSYLVTNQSKLVQALGVDSATARQLKNMYSVGVLTPEEYFTEIVTNWTGRLGKDATIENLQKILISCQFRGASGLFVWKSLYFYLVIFLCFCRHIKKLE